MPVEALVEERLLGVGIQDTMMVFVGVLVEVMIPQHWPQTFYPSHVSVREATHSPLCAQKADSQSLLDFQYDAPKAIHLPALGNYVIGLRFVESDSIRALVINEWMLIYSDFVDCSVMVVGVPVVGVSFSCSQRRT